MNIILIRLSISGTARRRTLNMMLGIITSFTVVNAILVGKLGTVLVSGSGQNGSAQTARSEGAPVVTIPSLTNMMKTVSN
jgi:hypothetical protein